MRSNGVPRSRSHARRCRRPRFQLVGLPVVEESGRELGTVQGVTPGVANDVLELSNGVLLPMIEDCVRSVDLEAGRITVAVGFAETQ